MRHKLWSPQGDTPSSRDCLLTLLRDSYCVHEARQQPPHRRDTPTLPNVPSNHGGDALVVMPASHSGQHPPLLTDRGPCLVAGVVTMDDSSFTSKIKIHSGPVAVQLDYVTLLYTGSPQTTINTHALESMKRANSSSAICERHTVRQVHTSPDVHRTTLKLAVLPRRPPNSITHRMGIRRPNRSDATQRVSRTRQLDAVP